jgi:hypothetical protein
LAVNKPLIVVAAICAIAAAAIAVYVAGHPYIREDVTIERDIQSTNWGPIALTFPIFSWIGDAKGAVLEAIIFVLVFVLNRRAWILAAAGALTGLWYVLLSHIIIRVRPTTPQVLQVTEHASASSFPKRSHHFHHHRDNGADVVPRAPLATAMGTAVAWLAFVVSVKWISDRALANRGATASHGSDLRSPT